MNPAQQTEALIAAGRLFHSRGWVPASGGNFSFRTSHEHLLITASGTHKGELGAEDLMQVDLEGRAIGSARRSSAETLLHCQIYRRFHDVGAVLHTHSVPSTVLSRRQSAVILQGYELLKILPGIDTHETAVEIPVFENDQDIARLAGRVDAAQAGGEGLCGYLIAGHGLYAWGRDVAEARYRVEALEFMFDSELQTELLARTTK